MNIVGDSSNNAVPAVQGANSAAGFGVEGSSNGSAGVRGTSDQFHGVWGVSNNNINAGVYGGNDSGGPGVVGDAKNGAAPGVLGLSQKFHGVWGISHDGAQAGVYGGNDAGGNGVIGSCDQGRGVAGFSQSYQGVYGHSQTQAGVVGESDKFHGVYGQSFDANNSGVYGINQTGGVGVIGVSDSGVGVFGKGAIAGSFEGHIQLTGNMNCSGDIRLLNADCAEEFDIAPSASGRPQCVDPGTVMVLAGGGALCPSQQAYDKRVAGIVSGAGTYRPALVLDRQAGSENRQPIALMGKVFCKVDARFGPVEIGDLLTTSPTPGHAMKAADPLKAFGSVIGKALRPLEDGQGLIPVLVALQ